MKRSAALILTELLVMLTVFAVAAAFCLKTFVWAHNSSELSAAMDMALLKSQNAAESLKHHRGDHSLAAQDLGGKWDGQGWRVCYDEQWKETDAESAYILEVMPEENAGYLGQAKLTVFDQNGQLLAELTVCWQEVAQ